MKSTFRCPLTESRTSDPDNEVGLLRYEGEKVYRFVKNDEAATALTLGQIGAHTAAGGAAALQNIKIPLTANLSMTAGVIVATDGIPAQSYGWIQVLGPNSTISMIGATTGGADIAPGSFMKPANAVAHLVVDATTQPLYKRNIQILTTFTTTTTPAAAAKAGFINCLG